MLIVDGLFSMHFFPTLPAIYSLLPCCGPSYKGVKTAAGCRSPVPPIASQCLMVFCRHFGCIFIHVGFKGLPSAPELCSVHTLMTGNISHWDAKLNDGATDNGRKGDFTNPIPSRISSLVPLLACLR